MFNETESVQNDQLVEGISEKAQEQNQTISEPEQQNVQVQQNQETAQAKNFRQLREKAERLEKERDELARKIYEKAQLPDAPEDDMLLGPDEIAEGKHLSKLHREVKQLKDQLKNYQQKTQETTAEARLKANYPDFDQVVNADNIAALRESEPELSASINANPDLYSKAVAAYKAIKNHNIYKENTHLTEKALAHKNSMKPKPIASVNPQQGDSPLSHANAFANGLTEELKSQLRKEMVEAMKNR